MEISNNNSITTNTNATTIELRILQRIPNDCRAHVKQMQNSWNRMQKIADSLKNTEEKVKEPVIKLRKQFDIALNQTVNLLWDNGYVSSNNQALMTICIDPLIQNNCIRFPKSPRRLADHLDEKNARRMLVYKRSTQTEERRSEDIEESSTSTPIFKQVSLLSDADLFKAVGLDDIRPYSVWTFGKDTIMGQQHPGKTPTGLVYNLLYFFTKIGDLVVDPMAGGGVVGDCCYETKRDCKMYDIKPKRQDITQHDMGDGIPRDMQNADLMFWDPPYYKMMHVQYGPESISSLPRNQYLKFFSEFTSKSYDAGIKKIALLISESTNSHLLSTNSNGNGEEPIFLCDYIQTFHKNKWKQLNRISCNIHPSAISSPEINEYRENKLIYGLARDLIIFQRS